MENNEECLGFQFDLIIPTGFTFLDSIITTEPINNFETQYSLIDSSTLRVFSYSTNQISKPLGKSVILKLLFNSSESSGIFNFNLDSIIIGNSGSENIYSDIDGLFLLEPSKLEILKLMINWIIIM